MTIPMWAAQALKRIEGGVATITDRLYTNPEEVFVKAGLTPDPWQARFLRSTAPRMIACNSRQTGKSQVSAALALKTMLLECPALVIIISPTQRQSTEVYRSKFLPLYRYWRDIVPPTKETELTMELANGSRIIAAPMNEEGIRGYSGVSLLILDEASRITDDLYGSVRPMLATSKGRLIAMSTPFGKRGWFYNEWFGGNEWERYMIPVSECPRIPKEFIEEERRAHGEKWFAQEYLCDFSEATDAVFRDADITAALSNEVSPMF